MNGGSSFRIVHGFSGEPSTHFVLFRRHPSHEVAIKSQCRPVETKQELYPFLSRSGKSSSEICTWKVQSSLENPECIRLALRIQPGLNSRQRDHRLQELK